MLKSFKCSCEVLSSRPQSHSSHKLNIRDTEQIKLSGNTRLDVAAAQDFYMRKSTFNQFITEGMCEYSIVVVYITNIMIFFCVNTLIYMSDIRELLLSS